MAKSVNWNSDQLIESKPKKTLQGRGKHPTYAATSRNKAKKRYRGEGKYCLLYTSDAADDMQ